VQKNGTVGGRAGSTRNTDTPALPSIIGRLDSETSPIVEWSGGDRAHQEETVAYRLWAGNGVYRVSVGLEHVEDLLRDLHHALE